MKIFDKRPLSMILCIMLGGFVFFTDCVLWLKISVFLLASASLILIQFLMKKHKNRLIASISLIALLVSSLLSFLYFDCYFNVYNHYHDRIEITARVTETKNTEYGASVYMQALSINGQAANHKLYAYVDVDTYPLVEKNTEVTFTALLKDFEENGEFLDRGHMRSMGYSAEAYEIEDFKVNCYTDESLYDKIKSYRIEICEYIINNSAEVGGGLLAALLLGERGYLPFQVHLSFKRCGLSHMLALSGLHLTIITFALSFLLSLMKVKKKGRKIIEIVFVILYSLITGMPISVVRAALMHIIASVIFLCAAKADSITSLSITVGIICFVIPYAIYDVSLWLSAFATLGVVVYSELNGVKIKSEKPRLFKKMLSGFLGGITISLFAISVTYLISTLSFGEISLIGAITTPLISLLITPFMYLGLVFLIVASFIPIGAVLNSFAILICGIVHSISSIKGIYISAEYIFTIILIIAFTVMLTLFLLLDIRKKKYPLLLLLIIYISSNASATLMNYINCSSDDSIYYCDDNDEYFLFKSNNEVHIIDVSSNSLSDAYTSINHIHNEKITEINSYIYTSYTQNMEASVMTLASSIYIENIYLPTPKTEGEERVFNILSNKFITSYTDIVSYTASDVLKLGKYEAIFPYRSLIKNKCAFLILDPNTFVTAYTSSGMLNDDTKNVASSIISKCDRLILGRHGERYFNFNFILKYDNLKEIIVSSKNLTIPNEMQFFYTDTAIMSSRERISLKR